MGSLERCFKSIKFGWCFEHIINVLFIYSEIFLLDVKISTKSELALLTPVKGRCPHQMYNVKNLQNSK